VKRAPSAPNSRLIALSRSAAVSVDRAAHPFSLNAPPNPSQICAAAVSSTVTSALPLVTSVSAPSVFQYAPGAEVISAGRVPVAPQVAPDGTQAPLHSIDPDAHRQAPASQVWSLEQGMPQPPQFSGSVATLAQARPHAT